MTNDERNIAGRRLSFLGHSTFVIRHSSLKFSPLSSPISSRGAFSSHTGPGSGQSPAPGTASGGGRPTEGAPRHSGRGQEPGANRKPVFSDSCLLRGPHVNCSAFRSARHAFQYVLRRRTKSFGR